MHLCKLCFQAIKPNNFYSLYNKNSLLCSSCYKKLKPNFQVFYINNVKAISIYNYDENFESLLYQFKGCSDIELAPVFLERFERELNLYFHDYIIVPIPSFHLDDLNRGFNHVEEIAKSFKLPILKILEKTEHIKQANMRKNDRNQISKILKLAILDSLENKKILLLDDVYTTGSTMKASIKLVKTLHPKDIKVLVISKTPYRKMTNTN